MKTKANRRELIYSASLISLFITASSLLKAPFSNSKYGNPIAIIIAGLIFIFTAIIFTKPISILCRIKNNGIFVKAVYVLISLVLFAVALFTAKEHTDFIYDIVLPRTERFLLAVIFLFCVFFLSLSKRDAVLKFSLISAFAVTLIFFVMFLLSVKNFSFKNVFYGVRWDIKLLLYDAFNYFLIMFLPAVIAVLFLSEKGKISAVSSMSGALWGLLLVSVCVADSVLSFGCLFATRLKYPYIDDISTVTVGSLFTRMDGFSYFAFFAAYLIKSAVCVRLAISFLKRTGVKHTKIATALFCAVSAFFI